MHRERLEELKVCLAAVEVGRVVDTEEGMPSSWENWDMDYFHETFTLERLLKIYKERGDSIDTDEFLTSKDVASDYPEIRHCGTACCALGKAALWNPFNKQGLTLRGSMLISYRGIQGANEAGVAFFELDQDQFNFLFDPGTYDFIDGYGQHPDEIIDRIDHLLEGGEV